MPSSRRTGRIFPSTSRSKTEYSYWSAGADVAQAEVLHLALGDQVADHAGDLLDRNGGVGDVLVEEVDVVAPQVAQAVLGDLADVFRAAVEGGAERLGGHVEAELGGEDHLVAEVLDRLAEEDLVAAGTGAVQLGGVEEVDPEFVGAADGRDALVLVRGAVGHGHAHDAQAERRDAQTLRAQSAVLHEFTPSVVRRFRPEGAKPNRSV
jgi:hypothetical protein